MFRIFLFTGCLLAVHMSSADDDLPKEIEHESAGKLVLIPVGEFMMGSPQSDPDARLNEQPQHLVSIDSPFYIGECEVTLGQFREFVGATNYLSTAEKLGSGAGFDKKTRSLQVGRQFSWRVPGFPQSDTHPVCLVSWHDATAYCNWLTTQDGVFRYRLPTEIEWEYCCRAQSLTHWNHGDIPSGFAHADNISDAAIRAVYDSETAVVRASSPWNDGHAFTAPVRSFSPNKFGLFDMHGNVSEWCSDVFVEDMYVKPSGYIPVLGVDSHDHCIRGGNWTWGPSVSRSAFRHSKRGNECTCAIGFRVVREATPKSSDAKTLALMPLYRFYDANLKQHVYTYGIEEPALWRQNGSFTNETIIGYVSHNEAPHTTRIWRYLMPDGTFYFLARVKGANSPDRVGNKLRAALDSKAKVQAFDVWGWSGRVDPRLVPVYACSMPDGTDMIFSRDRDEIRRANRDTWNSLGIKRHDFGIAFYVYPEALTE